MADGSDKMTPGGSAKGVQDWCTPPELVSLVCNVFGDIPELDPFSNENSVTSARTQYVGNQGSFREWFRGCVRYVEWDGWSTWDKDAATVFVNPPWKKTQAAIVKCRDEWLRVRGREVIGLFPTGPNCSSWPIVLRAPARCYPHKRIAFLEDGKPKTGNPKDVVIVYWGHDQYRFREVFRELGEVVFGA